MALTTDLETDLEVELAVQVAVESLPSPFQSEEQVAELEAFFQDCFLHWLSMLRPSLPAEWQCDAYEVTLRLTDDAEIQALNVQYRNKDQPTDVLSFAALEVDYPEAIAPDHPLELGDIVISVPTAQKQAHPIAAARRHSLQTELTWLATHGLLHLLGWDHPDDESLLHMLHQQSLLMGTVGLSAPEY